MVDTLRVLRAFIKASYRRLFMTNFIGIFAASLFLSFLFVPLMGLIGFFIISPLLVSIVAMTLIVMTSETACEAKQA